MNKHLEPILQEMKALVNKALDAGITLSSNRGFADGMWSVSVTPDGQVTVGGYAADHYEAVASDRIDMKTYTVKVPFDALSFDDVATLAQLAAQKLP